MISCPYLKQLAKWLFRWGYSKSTMAVIPVQRIMSRLIFRLRLKKSEKRKLHKMKIAQLVFIKMVLVILVQQFLIRIKSVNLM